MKHNFTDRAYQGMTAFFSMMIPLIFILIVWMLIQNAWPALRAYQWHFVIDSVWDPVQDHYGALPFIFGTLVSSCLALCLAVPVGLGCAIFLSEIASTRGGYWISIMVDLLAAIPSVVYGLWGIFVLGPVLATHVQPFLYRFFGFIPFFTEEYHGLSMMTASIILSIMILPTITSVSREVFHVVPRSLRESAMALGATRWETLKLAVFPPAVSGVIGSIILALGRAVGETMAVTMVIGNKPAISSSLFSPGYTLSAVIANEFTEAVSDLNFAVLFEIGLILLLLTIMINGIAKLLIWRLSAKHI